MKLSKEFLHSKFLHWLICYALAILLLNCWYGIEQQKLNLEMKKIGLHCIMQSRDPKVHEMNVRRARIDDAREEQLALLEEIKLINLGKYLWLIAIFPASFLVLLEISFSNVKTKSFTQIGTTIVLLLTLAGIVLGIVNQYFQ